MSRRMFGLGLWIIGLTTSFSIVAAPQINMGDIPAGKKVTITYDVTVNNNTVGDQISSQATVSGGNFVTLNSDDPDTATVGDATASSIEAAVTNVALVVSDTTPVSSQGVAFTATVSSSNAALGSPAGNVDFKINGGAATTVALDASGVAVFNTNFSVGNYTVTADYAGDATFAAANNSSSITVNSASTSIMITSVTPASVYPNDTVAVNFGVSIEAAASALPVTGTVNITDGTDSCSANVAAGSCSIQFADPGTKNLIATYTSSSPEVNGSVSAAVVVDVINNAPVLASIGNQSVEATQTLSFNTNATDVDPAADISYSLGAGAPSGAAINASTGAFSWTPTEAQGGAIYSVTVIAADQFNSSDSKTFSIDVAVSDNPPVLNNDNISTDEDTDVSFDPFSNDNDDIGFDFSTIDIVSQPASGTLEFNASTGSMTYRPAENFNGSDQAQYQVKDDAGQVSNVATISFTVNLANDVPVFESAPIASVIEGEVYSYNLVVTDADGQPVTLTATTLPSWLQLIGNQLMGTPLTDDRGLHDVVLSATDGLETAEQVFEINVVSVFSNDLALVQTVSNEAPLVDEEFSLHYSLTNGGPDQASAVELVVKLDGDAIITAMDSRCVANVLEVSCSVGVVPIDQTEELEITLKGNQLGDIYSFAKIVANDDFDTANNEAGLGVSVTNGVMSDKAEAIGESESQLVVTGDVDNDGDDDVVLLRGAESIASVFINQGSNTFVKASDVMGGESATDAQLDYINDDQYIDLVVVTENGEATLVYAGDGSGGFILEQTLLIAESRAVAIADINDDGWMDVIVANSGLNQVYLNQSGVLQLSHTLGVAEDSVAVVLADVDGDSLFDAVIANADGTSYFYSNMQLLDNTGTPNNYTTLNTGPVSDISVIDIDGNGTPELVFAVGVDQQDFSQTPSNKIYQWSGSLSEMQSFGGVDSSQVIVNDIDGDGDEDMFVTNKSGFHQIYLNDAGVLTVTPDLLLNKDFTDAAWVLGDTGLYNLVLAESLNEGSALYYNQGQGQFGFAETDLALTVAATRSAVTQQGVVGLSYTITNNGPGIAREVEFSFTANSTVKVIAYRSGIEGCETTDTSMNCSFEQLQPGESMSIPLQLVALTQGNVSLRGEVSSALPDSMPSNNVVAIDITISQRSNGGGGQVGLWLLLLLGLATIRRRYKL